MKITTVLISILVLSLSLNAEYICSSDQAFQDWITQGEEIDNSSGSQLVKYSNLDSCKNQCKKVSTCSARNEGGYTCSLYDSNTDLGGNLEPNAFSDESTCTSKCFIQQNCVAWNGSPNCVPTAFEKTKPVSDWTGKTVFTQYNISWNCESVEMLHGGCLEYETVVLEDNTTFDLSKIGWESKEFGGHDEAMTAVAEMEQFQHIWSGWSGMCESGTNFDSSFLSDPMTLLSFAMMAYSGALQGAYGEVGGYMAYPIASATQSVQSSFVTIGNSVSEAATKASDAISNAAGSVKDMMGFAPTEVGQTVVESTDALERGIELTEVAIDKAADFKDKVAEASSWGQIKDFLGTEIVGATDYTTAVTYGSAMMDAAQIAMAALSEPEENHLRIADDYMKAQLGSPDASVAAVNYAQCMAAIGLSFPNLMGHAVDSSDAMSVELKEPWKNKIRLSTNQLAHLMNATSENFVRANYIQIKNDGGVGVFVAITSLAYQQAGQVICGNGTIALAMNINNQVASDEGGGINAEAMAMAAVGAALSYLPPPYNLMASIAFKVLTALSEGNACSDEDIAMKWGMQQYKTNKALRFKQCRYIDSECAAKWFWGSCMRKRKHYCCYDQEMTRIFVEGAKEQIPKEWQVGNCSDLEIKDLKNISFRKCLVGESPIEDKCFPIEKWEELEVAIGKQTAKGFDAESLTDMAIDSMPIGDDPWGPRIGD